MKLKLKLRKLIRNSVLKAKKTFKLLVVQIDRDTVANTYIRGRGIEIGALHSPLKVPDKAHVTYVDRLPIADLLQQYPEMRSEKLVPVDIVADGERLEPLADAGQDFVIANHFVEHCQNPLLAVKNIFRVLKPGGVLYLALPDKRFTFDAARPVTTTEHLLRDFQDGSQCSRHDHFTEWVRCVEGIADGQDAVERVSMLMQQDYSIHYHVWSHKEMIELVLLLQAMIPFEIELMLRSNEEVIFILRKHEE
jgi:predicted SAM-dependent methyltransferase